MSKPRLIYFDFAGSRGEECRIALHLAGVDFDDVRIPIAEWPELKPQTPFGSLPNRTQFLSTSAGSMDCTQRMLLTLHITRR